MLKKQVRCNIWFSCWQDKSGWLVGFHSLCFYFICLPLGNRTAKLDHRVIIVSATCFGSTLVDSCLPIRIQAAYSCCLQLLLLQTIRAVTSGENGQKNKVIEREYPYSSIPLISGALHLLTAGVPDTSFVSRRASTVAHFFLSLFFAFFFAHLSLDFFFRFLDDTAGFSPLSLSSTASDWRLSSLSSEELSPSNDDAPGHHCILNINYRWVTHSQIYC